MMPKKQVISALNTMRPKSVFVRAPKNPFFDAATFKYPRNNERLGLTVLHLDGGTVTHGFHR